MRPLVLTGADVPALLGADVTAPVCYVWSGASWSGCPLQIDERDWLDPAIAYPTTISDASELFGGPLQLLYTEPQDYPHADFDPIVPVDSDTTFDADDELVVMLRFFGAKADLSANPPPYAPPQVSEIEAGGVYAYLFVPTQPLDQAAGYDLVSYQFNLLAGSFPSQYNFEGSTSLQNTVGDYLAANPEYSVVETNHYRSSFEDRWIQRELALAEVSSARRGAGASVTYGTDLLDRVKFGARPYQLGSNHDCSRSIYSASARRGTLGVQKDGPVRALRYAQGFNSGGHNYVLYEMYEQYIVYRMAHQMHRTPGATMFFDYAPAVSGMTYYSNLLSGGVTIDGQPDLPTGDFIQPAYLEWDYLLGTQGSLVSVWESDSNISGLTPRSYFEDNASPEVGQCTGDATAYGSTGNVYYAGTDEDGYMPWTDPTDPRSFDGGTLRYLRLVRKLALDGATRTATEAQTLRDSLAAAPTSTVSLVSVGTGNYPQAVLDLRGSTLADNGVADLDRFGTWPDLSPNTLDATATKPKRWPLLRDPVAPLADQPAVFFNTKTFLTLPASDSLI
ncbi:MAG: hypothetical protein AAGF99_17605, partial [Bacteroidota bacterium]